jgi:hypothetical protein
MELLRIPHGRFHVVIGLMVRGEEASNEGDIRFFIKDYLCYCFLATTAHVMDSLLGG